MKTRNPLFFCVCLCFFGFIYFPINGLCQTIENNGDNISTNGISFYRANSWDQLKATAQEQNKYIFIDCFATWCGPCKRMDKDIFSDTRVGNLVNKHFVSAKIQMDVTEKDDSLVQRWYRQAKTLKEKYNINSFPTYLFFSPNGELVHVGGGFKNVNDFMGLVEDAINPKSQYGSLLNQYRLGNKDYKTLSSLAITVKEIDKSFADTIALDYKLNYLDKVPDSIFFSKENIKFMTSYFPFLSISDGSKGRLFQYCYLKSSEINDLMKNQNFSKVYVKWIITTEDLQNVLFKNGKAITLNPNWNRLRAEIEAKYGLSIASEIINSYKVRFYLRSENWKKWASIKQREMKRYKPKKDGRGLSPLYSDEFTLNENAWTVFEYCLNKKVLRKALEWSSLAIKLQESKVWGSFLDTQANLLYKLGKIDEAILLEMKAVESETSKGKSGRVFIQTLDKMRKGEATWKQ